MVGGGGRGGGSSIWNIMQTLDQQRKDRRRTSLGSRSFPARTSRVWIPGGLPPRLRGCGVSCWSLSWRSSGRGSQHFPLGSEIGRPVKRLALASGGACPLWCIVIDILVDSSLSFNAWNKHFNPFARTTWSTIVYYRKKSLCETIFIYSFELSYKFKEFSKFLIWQVTTIQVARI